VAKTLTDRARVRRHYPAAYAYRWGPREWNIYAAVYGPFAGICVSGGTRTSQKAAWMFAAMELPKRRRVKGTTTP